MAEEKTFRVKIVAPDRVFYEGDAEMLEMTTTEGDIGVLKGHIPLTAVIAPGVLAIHDTVGGNIRIAALHSGFVEILPDSVTVLAETVEWPEEIDINRANEARIRAERRLQERPDGLNIARAELALKKALVRAQSVEESNNKK